MPPLGALTQAWTAAEAALPLGWQLSGLYRFDELWVGLAEGPVWVDALDYAATSSRGEAGHEGEEWATVSTHRRAGACRDRLRPARVDKFAADFRPGVYIV